MQLTRLTTQFVENEDRYLISADSDAGIVNLWLTQRLLKRLLPHLIKWVGQPHASDHHRPQIKKTDIEHDEDQLKHSGHVHEQAASQLVAQHRKPVANVSSDAAVKTCLVHTLKFQARGDVLRLVFELPDGDEALLLLQEEHARIWLGVVYRHWQQAQWPDIWPDWMKKAQGIRQASPVSLMH